MPRNRVYDAIEELQGLGLLDVTLSVPRILYARPLAGFLEERVAEMRRSIDDLERQKEALANAFPLLEGGDREPRRGETRAVNGRAGVARELDRLVDRARVRVFAVATPGGATRLARHLVPALAHGVAVDVLVPRSAAPAGGLEPLQDAPGVALGWLDEDVPALSLVVDGDEAIVVHPVPDDGALRVGRDIGIVTSDPAFVGERLAMFRFAARSCK